jgi:hypothetical protein
MGGAVAVLTPAAARDDVDDKVRSILAGIPTALVRALTDSERLLSGLRFLPGVGTTAISLPT